MDDAQFVRCQELIARRMGYSWRQQDMEAVRRTLDNRVAALRCPGVDDYLLLLQKSSPAAETEWKRLFCLLTNQESYFFRDQGHFAMLREHILPDLIRKNKPARKLRIWSAGCSTGEEPYSLAMLVDQLLPFRDDWRISIFGTDLSDAALEKARNGTYGAWSFRNVDEDLRKRYFHAKGREFQLNDTIRAMVTFQHGNLIADEIPNRAAGLTEMDLILCRNVFIYFKRDAVGRVVQKFTHTLTEGGFLLTGHAELHDVPMRELEPRQYSHAIIYRKRDAPLPDEPDAVQVIKEAFRPPKPPASKPAPPKAAPAIPVKPAPVSVPAADSRQTALEKARQHLRRGATAAALQELEPLLSRDAGDVLALCLAARARANAGGLDAALELCKQARAMDSGSALPLHVMASIAEERGEHGEAKELLKKVLYLAPEFVWPYVELSAIYEREGDRARAQTMRQAVIKLLTPFPPDHLAPIDPLGLEPPVPSGQLLADLEGAST